MARNDRHWRGPHTPGTKSTRFGRTCELHHDRQLVGVVGVGVVGVGVIGFGVGRGTGVGVVGVGLGPGMGTVPPQMVQPVQ